MDQPFIVGVSGKKRHGKDTVGQTLVGNGGFMQTAFADPLKLMAMELFWLSYDQCYGGPGIDRELIDPRWGLSPREIMQRIGTEVGRNVHTEVWVRNTLKHIQDAFAGREVNLHNQAERRFVPHTTFAPKTASRWVITDCRFPNESEAVKAAGGIVVKVHRPGMASGDTHASETSVDLVKEDHLLINDGTLEDLAAQVRELPFMVRRSASL
jgi:hypothetical protein